jgi:hypothetical protein
MSINNVIVKTSIIYQELLVITEKRISTKEVSELMQTVPNIEKVKSARAVMPSDESFITPVILSFIDKKYMSNAAIRKSKNAIEEVLSKRYKK